MCSLWSICFFCMQIFRVWTTEICLELTLTLILFFSFKPQVPKVVEKVFFTTALPVAGNTGKHVWFQTFFFLFLCLPVIVLALPGMCGDFNCFHKQSACQRGDTVLCKNLDQTFKIWAQPVQVGHQQRVPVYIFWFFFFTFCWGYSLCLKK